MTIVTDSIAAQTAELAREIAVPTGALGFGVDLSCVTDLTEDMAEVDPFTARGIAEAIARRLITPRGSLPDDLGYGLDVRGYCNRATTARELNELRGQVVNEVAADDRVSSATVDVVVAGKGLSVKVMITPEDPSLKPFTLTLAVTDASALIESIT
jgi:hypothetical protein